MSDEKDIQAVIREAVEENPVLLFMKGNPDAPQCGFSAQVVQYNSLELHPLKRFSHGCTLFLPPGAR